MGDASIPVARLQQFGITTAIGLVALTLLVCTIVSFYRRLIIKKKD